MPHKDIGAAKECKRRYYLANIEKIKKYRSEKYRANPQIVKDKVAEWCKANPEKRKAQCAKYRIKHKDELSAYHRNKTVVVKEKVMRHYSGGQPLCAVCSHTDIDVLQIDHINNDGGSHRRSVNAFGGISFYNRLIKEGYPEGFQVLCANCNTKKEMMRRRPWLQ